MATAVMAAPQAPGSDVNRLLAQARQATDKYHDVSVALADGYIPASPCEPEMGIHYVNFALASDLLVNELTPEILLYVPDEEIGFRLVGVEYFMAAIGTVTFPNGTTYTGPWWEMDLPPGWVWFTTPTLYGQSMDGPMEPHVLGLMPWHYDFHVYLWQANPDGIFEEWNPTVKC